MAIFARIMIALMLVLQTLPGVGMGRCAAMAGASDSAVRATADEEDQPCACCRVNEDANAGCASEEAPAACCCAAPTSEEPKAPASDPKLERVQFVVAVLPEVLVVGLGKPEPQGPCTMALGGKPRISCDSVQSILCVWVM